MSEWQAAETAPKDGRWIGLYWETAAAFEAPYAVARFDVELGVYVDENYRGCYNFSQWMPLTEPPK